MAQRKKRKSELIDELVDWLLDWRDYYRELEAEQDEREAFIMQIDKAIRETRMKLELKKRQRQPQSSPCRARNRKTGRRSGNSVSTVDVSRVPDDQPYTRTFLQMAAKE